MHRMDELIQFKTAIDEFEMLHEKHLTAFNESGPPDLEKQSRERWTGIRKLLETANQLLSSSDKQDSISDVSAPADFSRRMKTLLEKNKMLETHATELKEQLKKEMLRISKGKKVIGAYRSPNTFSSKPRVLNIKN